MATDVIYAAGSRTHILKLTSGNTFRRDFRRAHVEGIMANQKGIMANQKGIKTNWQLQYIIHELLFAKP